MSYRCAASRRRIGDEERRCGELRSLSAFLCRRLGDFEKTRRESPHIEPLSPCRLPLGVERINLVVLEPAHGGDPAFDPQTRIDNETIRSNCFPQSSDTRSDTRNAAGGSFQRRPSKRLEQTG